MTVTECHGGCGNRGCHACLLRLGREWVIGNCRGASWGSQPWSDEMADIDRWELQCVEAVASSPSPLVSFLMPALCWRKSLNVSGGGAPRGGGAPGSLALVKWSTPVKWTRKTKHKMNRTTGRVSWNMDEGTWIDLITRATKCWLRHSELCDT